jgi:hypothetical protein
MNRRKREMGVLDVDLRAKCNKAALDRKKIIDVCRNFALLMRNRMLDKYEEGRRDWDKAKNLEMFQDMAVHKSNDSDSIDAANYNMFVYYHTKIAGKE